MAKSLITWQKLKILYVAIENLKNSCPFLAQGMSNFSYAHGGEHWSWCKRVYSSSFFSVKKSKIPFGEGAGKWLWLERFCKIKLADENNVACQ